MFYRDFVYRLINRFGKARGWVGGGHLRAQTLPAGFQILPQNDPSPLPKFLTQREPSLGVQHGHCETYAAFGYGFLSDNSAPFFTS